MRLTSVIIVGISIFTLCCGRDAEEWRSRVVYQVLTDRFATSDETQPSQQCEDLTTYCNGTWRGIANHLDYIKELGADAIWISPIALNIEGNYHGYAPLDIYDVDPHFGTKEDLRYLVEQAHRRNIWIMVDIIPNHMGRQDGCNDTGCYPDGAEKEFSKYTPFDKEEYYHPFCMWDGQSSDQKLLEECRIFNLPDINQTHPWVLDTLLKHAHDLAVNYSFDGYRIDTVRHINLNFWGPYQQAADIYCIGEVWNEHDIPYVANYQGPEYLNAVFHFPLHGAINRVFRDNQTMSQITDVMTESSKHFTDTSVLGLFVDNHDMARFLHNQPDKTLFENALTFIMFADGIPFIYYGSEQAFNGGSDPECRESMWPHFDKEAELFQFIKGNLDFRRQQIANINDSAHENLVVHDDILVFSRADKHVLVAVSNIGEGGSANATVSNIGLPDKTRFENILVQSDAIEVEDGSLTIQLTNGKAKVYHLKELGPADGAPKLTSGLFVFAGLACMMFLRAEIPEI